ncbi:MAG: hypothetical protein E7394_08985 [Ruminococcaceae bacterium]|nr:hypothetical protein [Oscillospiraceae bacterium]
MNYYITPDYAPAPNGLYLFEKTFELKNEGVATINIFAASRYILYINGKYVCEGPCRSHEKVRFYDCIETFLKQGENHITVNVLHVTDFLTSVYDTVLPELVFELTLGEEVVSSDASWQIKFMSGYSYKTYHMKTTGPYEWIVADKECTELGCRQIAECTFREKGSFNRVGHSPKYILEKRPLPMIYPQKEQKLNIIKKGNDFLEFDAGEYMTAKLKFVIGKNATIKIIYSECYEFEDGKRRRDDASGQLKGFYDFVETGNEAFVYEPFWYRAFRFIRIEGTVDKLETVTAYRVNYPIELSGSFECSDEYFNKMQRISVNTIRCCTHEIIADCPYYEQQQYSMDSYIQLAVISRMTADKRLHRKCINEFVHGQHENGLIQSIYPSTEVQFIPGFSLFWIMMLRDYLSDTGDTEFVSRYVGNIDNLLGYFDRVVRSNGYVTNSPYWDFVDWVPEWNFGAVPLRNEEAHTIYNLYYAYALKNASYILKVIGRNSLADEYEARHKAIAETVNQICFDSERALYTDGSVTKTYSMHTVIWSILSEVVPPENFYDVLSHIADNSISKCSYSMKYFVFRVFEKAGIYDKAFSLFDDWRKMIDLGCTTWCENPDSPRSECHGWSSVPLYEFSANILGVKTGIEDEIVINPSLGHLTYAKGTVPTRFGIVKISWHFNEGVFEIRINSPEKTRKKLILPTGEIFDFENDDAFFKCNYSIED